MPPSTPSAAPSTRAVCAGRRNLAGGFPIGLDTAAYSDAYVTGSAAEDMDLVKQCAETVLRVAKQVLTNLTPGRADADPDDDLAESAAPVAGLATAMS